VQSIDLVRVAEASILRVRKLLWCNGLSSGKGSFLFRFC
jgi:hypothetical protein